MERGQKFSKLCGNIVYAKLSYTESEINSEVILWIISI